MKKLGLYAIKDTNGNEFHQPFCQPSPQQAIRMFKTEVNRAAPDNLAYLYPEEFDLYFLGELDQETGIIEPKQEKLLNGKAVKNT